MQQLENLKQKILKDVKQNNNKNKVLKYNLSKNKKFVVKKSKDIS